MIVPSDALSGQGYDKAECRGEVGALPPLSAELGHDEFSAGQPQEKRGEVGTQGPYLEPQRPHPTHPIYT